MATTFVSRTPVLPAVIQGAYDWFFPEHTNGATLLTDYASPMAFYTIGQLELPFESCTEDQFIFDSFVEQWRTERGATSSTTEMILCPAYQSIIGMGSKAVPLILARMQREGDDPDQWFWALQMLTGANPVDPDDDGNFQRMAQAWLEWAAGRYVW